MTETSYIPAPAPDKRKPRLPRWALLAIGALFLAGAGVGTFASFSASTTNSGSFATGTLVLSNQKDANTVCMSTTAGITDVNDNAGCDAAYALTLARPGDIATVNITLKNEGSLDATDLKAFVSTACATTDEGTETYHGTGDLCANLRFYIQGFTTSGRTVVTSCYYGATTVANTCDFTDGAKTLAAYGTAYPNAGTTLSMGALTTGTTRYLTIGLSLPSAAGNTLQGRKAAFGLKWQIVQ